MAIANALKARLGREIVERLYAEMRGGMRGGVDVYRQHLAAGRPVEAIAQLRRAVDLPHRIRARINYAITLYTQQFVVDAISQAIGAGVTLSELNSDLTIAEAYAQTLVNHVNNDGWTWDQVASDIEANVPDERPKFVVPFPPGYVDVWGN